ncbi:polymorphic toxin-type HINT domain-containing protein [Actinorugispora endophytica]|uniref:polymorphic toxin-type HINT domain-containing protein n=1 Tax=Actinorugispora endophytica TaxID=1605990 RepID=UPI001061AABF|nr:polymorphic toxin-type HINT domain-containing protein [Actinorugispora endophytica]
MGDYYADLLWNHPRENLVGTIESVLDPLGTMDAMMDGVVDTAVTMRDEYAENRRAALDQLLSGDVLGGIGTYVGGSLRITVWDNPYNGLAIARGLWGSASEHVENGEYGRAAADVASEVLGWVGPGRVGRILDILKRGPDAPSAPDRPGSHPQAGADDPPDTTGRDEEGATRSRPEEGENPGVSCPVGANSFVPGTLVLMADGGYRAIEGIDAGERVWAFDPATGEEGPRVVTDLITGGGAKTLVDITVVDDTGEAGTVTATDEHPFWAVERAEWVAAVDLEPGEWLRTSAGTWAQVSAVETRAVPDQQVHNLTVEDLHTYYVAVGGVGVLVHNDGCTPIRDIVTDENGGLIGWENSRGVRVVTPQELQDVRARLREEYGDPTVREVPGKGTVEVWEVEGGKINYRNFSSSGGSNDPTIDFSGFSDLGMKRLHSEE